MGKTKSFYLLKFCALLLVTTITALAQYRAGIQGSVTDSGGGLVPGATVTITSQETSVSHSTETSDSGSYFIQGLAPGKYTVTVEKAGFSKKSLSDVQIGAEQIQGINITLDVGAVTQTVEVSAAVTPQIDTESAQISGQVTDKQIHDLPSLNRDPYQLMRLAPGVFGDGQNIPASGQGACGNIYCVENGVQIVSGGARESTNSFQIDGVGVNSTAWGGSPVITPNEESVKEVKIIANNYTAENGRNSGTQVQVVSQNGTNDLHGSAFFKFHRPGLDAFQRENPNGITKDVQRFNQFGGSIGGPVVRNRLFAFFSYETQRDHSQSLSSGWYPTAQFLQNAAPANSLAQRIMSYPGTNVVSSTNLNKSCGYAGLDPTECQEVSGGLDLGSPLKSGLGKSDPTFSSTFTGIGGGFDGVPDIVYLQTNSPSSDVNVQYNGRLDYQATTKDLIAFSGYFVPVSSTSYNGPAYVLNLYHHQQLSQAWTTLWTHTINPTTINEARFNLSGWSYNEIQTNPQLAWGIPAIQIDTLGNIGGNQTFESFGAPAAGVFNQKTFNARDIVTKVQGSHNIRLGADISWSRFFDQAPWAGLPTYDFHNLWDFANDATYQETGSFNPVTGQPTATIKHLRFSDIGLFIQDDWKVRPNLTVNLGLRWEDFTPLTEQNGNISNIVLGSGANAISNLYVRKGGQLTQNQMLNFGPQLGFAWSPSSVLGRKGLVFRGGFGIGYNLEQLAITSNGRFNPPLQVNLTLTGNNINYALAQNLALANNWPVNSAAIETFNNNGLPVSAAGNTVAPVGLTGFPWDLKTTATYRYSFDAQYDLGHHWSASLGYQGSQTRHGTQQTQMTWLLFPQSNPLVQSVDWYANSASAHFNALLAEVQHRFGGQFDIDAQYRLSRSIDTASNDYYQDSYPWNNAHQYGPSDFDATHNFKVWGVWNPKLFRGGHGFAEKVLGGWTLSGILTAHTGYPWTPQFCLGYPNALYANSGLSCEYPTSYNGKAGTNYSNNAFLTGSNFASGALNYFGVLSAWPNGLPPAPGIDRNSFRGPGFFGNDVQIAKAFGFPKIGLLGENLRLNFQANLYNLVNKTNLNGINNTITSNGTTSNSQFGEATNAFPGRVVEFQIRLSF